MGKRLLTRRVFVRTAAAAAGAVALGAALPMAGCAPAGDVLRVGTKVDVPGFGVQNPETGNVEGLEVDVARAVASPLMRAASSRATSRAMRTRSSSPG